MWVWECSLVARAKGKVNHRLLLVRMAVLISERDHVWGVVCAKEDGQRKHRTSTNKNLVVVLVEQYQNSAYANDLYFT